jgi:hypothetical protein
MGMCDWGWTLFSWFHINEFNESIMQVFDLPLFPCMYDCQFETLFISFFFITHIPHTCTSPPKPDTV